MPYLNLDIHYFEHRKTLRLVSILGQGAAEYPLRLWAYCAKHHAADGLLKGYTGLEIERIVGWSGTPGALIRALTRTGFVEKCQKVLKVHEWENHEGHLINFHERAKTAASRRWGKMLDSPTSNATSIAQPDSKQCPYHTIPSVPTVHDPTTPTPEPVGGGGASLPETATAIERELAAVGYAKPDPKVEPERALACTYREIRKIPKYSWAEWDEKHLEDFKPHLREIISACGSLPRASECLKDKIEHFESQGFKHWTIRGIAKNAFQWVESHPEESHADHLDRESSSVSDADEQRQRKTNALRNKHASAKVLDRIRNLPIVQPSAETANGHGDRGDETNRNGVQENSLEEADHRIQSGKSEPEQ